MPSCVKIRVPGTTANCGPGFDSVGISCSIYNDLELTLSEHGNLNIIIEGSGKGIIPTDARNIVCSAVQAVLTRVEQNYKGITIKMDNHIPLARGLGSSAAAIVGGLLAANAATGSQLDKQELFNMATNIEGHPDNVAPALFGGITLSVMEASGARCLRFMPPNDLSMVVAIPKFTLSTKAAREVLPQTISFADACFNVSRTALLIGSLCKGEFQHLKYALEDKLHQPYRERLIPGMQDVFQAAIDQGALGATISGAGPCLMAFTQCNQKAIGTAMVQAFQDHGIQATYLVLSIDTEGARII